MMKIRYVLFHDPSPMPDVLSLILLLKEFTMDMMLNTLNVDLKIIGFDRENQRWNKP